MTNKTITLARVRAADSLYLTMWPNDTLHECETGNPKWNACLNAIDAGYTKEVSAALADPVPPAGGEPEVFEPHGWAQTDGPRINAFTREFDIAEEWAMAGYGTVELLNREHVDDEIYRLRGEHQAHVTRLKAEVELLAAARHKLCIENENLQSELTKTKADSKRLAELDDQTINHLGNYLRASQSELTKAREELKQAQVCERFVGYLLDNCEREVIYEESLQHWMAEMLAKEANQSAPADTCCGSCPAGCVVQSADNGGRP